VSLNAGSYTDGLKLSRLDADVRLQDTAVSGQLLIENSTFRSALSLDRMQSSAPVEIRDVTFVGSVSFHSGIYRDRVVFHNVEFQREVTFDSAQFLSRVVFHDVRFLGPVSFRDALFRDRLRFEHVRFDGAVDLDIEVSRMKLVNTTFAVQASLVLENADLIVERSRFAAPVTIDSRSTCRLRSLSGTDATNLTLAEVSLGTCPLSDVYNLDRHLQRVPPRRLHGCHFRQAQGCASGYRTWMRSSLAGQAPDLHDALQQAKDECAAYVIQRRNR
jgi:hypothetical protein